MNRLEKLLALYHDYVHSCLMYDDPVEEIMGWDQWANLHHGVAKEEADEYLAAAT